MAGLVPSVLWDVKMLMLIVRQKELKSVGPRKSFISWLLDGEVADGCVDGGEGYGWYAAQVCKDGWQRLELFLLYALLLFLVKLMVILKLCFAMDEDW